MSDQPVVFPFSAIVGQEDLKMALLLNAVSPQVGGVLIRGEKGNGKSTAVRAMADLLPPVSVVSGCSLGCDPQEPFSFCPHCEGTATEEKTHQQPPVVELPLGAMEDRLLGHPDLEAVLQRGERRFQPGLLAKAHRGILYVDEVNLLEDHLVDLLLDVAASGRNRVEREGFSVVHPARFILIGTMNPEEGDLRPQLLDRFGLSVQVQTPSESALRLLVMERRMAFAQDPAGFYTQWAHAQREEADRLKRARQRVNRVSIAPERLEQVARICTEARTEGLRADLVICEAAKAHAAYEGREEVSADDVNLAARLALSHRAREPWQPDPGPSGGGSSDDHPGDGEPDEGDGESKALPPSSTESSPSMEGGTDKGKEMPQQSSTPQESPDAEMEPNTQDPIKESLFPVDSWFRVASDALEPSSQRAVEDNGPASTSPSRTRHIPRKEHPFRGRWLRSRLWQEGANPSIDWEGSLVAAHSRGTVLEEGAPYHRLRREDLREKVFLQPDRNRVLFLIDASGSMAGYRRMEQVKGAVHSWMEHCYRQREEVALLSFRNGEVNEWLPPTRSIQAATEALERLPSGGGTPLAEALEKSSLSLERWGSRFGQNRLVVVTDGRLNLPPSGKLSSLDDVFQPVRAAARKIAKAGISSTVVDTETGPIRLGWCRRLARELRGTYRVLEELRQPDSQVRGIG